MASSSAVPVEEYLRTTYHPDMEYLDGQLVERHVGEYFHSYLQSLIVGVLLSRHREHGFHVFTEQRVKSERSAALPDSRYLREGSASPDHANPAATRVGDRGCVT
jgi:hypothetical protein